MCKREIIQKLNRGLIVSCQALPDEPLYGCHIMAKMALAAKLGGAVGIRANGFEDIVDIKKEVELPVIGLKKEKYDDSMVYITPTMKEVQSVMDSGAEVVTMDATNRIRPGNVSLKEFVTEVKRSFPDRMLMADISTFQEAIEAERLGFDMVSTTLNGYTEYTKDCQIPDLQLLRKLVKEISVPVIAEGGFWTVEQLQEAFKAGVHAVVIGTAITRPMEITKRFVNALLA